MLHFFFFWKCSMDLTSSSFSLSQQIITQDFARNQVSSQPPQQPSTSTFQSSPSALVSTPVRTKTSNRYSPESQSQSAHHQRPGSRVSPETLVDKSRARYGLPHPHTGSPAVRQSDSTFTLGIHVLRRVSLPSFPGKCNWEFFLCVLFLECPLSRQLVLYVFIMCPQVDCCPLSVGLQTVLWHGWLGGNVGTLPGSSESQCVQMFRKLALNNLRPLSTGLSPVFSPVLCTWKLKVVGWVLVCTLVDGEQAAHRFVKFIKMLRTSLGFSRSRILQISGDTWQVDGPGQWKQQLIL